MDATRLLFSFLAASTGFSTLVSAQSADWTEVAWREPQVRYLLADMTGSGKTDLYRRYAPRKRIPTRASRADALNF